MRNWGVCKDCALKENCAEYKPNKLQCEDYERYKEVLTNEEWFCTLSTEEKAKFMCNIYEMGKNGKEYFMRLDKCVEWLKQPHKDE